MVNKPVAHKDKPLLRFYESNKKNVIALGMIVLVFVAGELIMGSIMGAKPGSFLSSTQILLTIRLAAFIALFGLCQMVVISVGGGLDLSVGYIATLSAVLSSRIIGGQNSNLLLGVLLALVIGAAFGFANGVLISYAALPPLVVTMAMANIVQGIVNAYVASFNIKGQAAPALVWAVAKFTGPLPNILFILAVVCIVAHILLKYTQVGVRILGVGSNETTAYLSGINVRRVRCMAFVVSGMCAAVIGVLLVGNAGQAYKDMGSIYVMPSVVAVVIGGISIVGGQANYFSVVLGAVVLQSLTNLFVALGWGDAGKWLGYGIILLLMLIAYVRNKRSR